ncbi:hypothetical protein DFH28DRAFT_948008 [Melampsora americana]|nr:hypothetical protein DFH28DRAFT_948008 [Melampsora americana]
MNHQINFQHLAMLVTLALVFWLIWQLQCLSSDWAQAEILLKPSSPVGIHMLHEKVEGPEGIQSKGTKLWSLRGSLVKRGGEFSFARQVEKTPYTMKSVEREMNNGIGRSESSSRSVENAEMSKLNEIPREMEKVASFDELRISEKRELKGFDSQIVKKKISTRSDIDTFHLINKKKTKRSSNKLSNSLEHQKLKRQLRLKMNL